MTRREDLLFDLCSGMSARLLVVFTSVLCSTVPRLISFLIVVMLRFSNLAICLFGVLLLNSFSITFLSSRVI